MMKPLTVAINGFGRIGRTVLRQWLTTTLGDGLEIVHINDIAPADTCAYLFGFDSVFGPFPETVSAAEDALIIGERRIPLTRKFDLSEVDLSGVDLVFECTGKANARGFAEAGLRAGAAKVLISGPSPAADATVVMGVNHDDARGLDVVSNASCTTNALAPLVNLIDARFGLISAHMTTIHCYTGSQPTVDAPRGDDLIRNRAAALSMVPTSTSAGALVGEVLPHLADRITARAVRVPTASVSSVDLTFTADLKVTRDNLEDALKAQVGPLLGWCDQPLVSSDLRARSESLIVAGPEVMAPGHGLARVFGWYDNEWGFSARMFDMARVMLT